MSGFSLWARNAVACEQAKHPRCVCYCGGAGHGKAHQLADVVRAFLQANPAIDFDSFSQLALFQEE